MSPGPATVRIEPMTERDVEAVVAIAASPSTGVTQIRDELGRKWSLSWVAREEGEGVVAFLLSWHVADELHVLNITTRDDRRRRGIGRALLDTAVAYARENAVSHVLLEVRRSNEAALGLYCSTGFVPERVRPRYYPDDEDAVEMMLRLDPTTTPP
jgi:[ribosomal protein S18]-alanine N-acetyltransferase